MKLLKSSPTPSELVSNGILRAVEDLDLTGNAVARIIGISAATFSRLRAGSWRFQEGSKPYELALALLRIHHALKSVMSGNIERMRKWLRARHDAFGAAPVERLAQIQGLFGVLHHLETTEKA